MGRMLVGLDLLTPITQDWQLQDNSPSDIDVTHKASIKLTFSILRKMHHSQEKAFIYNAKRMCCKLYLTCSILISKYYGLFAAGQTFSWPVPPQFTMSPHSLIFLHLSSCSTIACGNFSFCSQENCIGFILINDSGNILS